MKDEQNVFGYFDELTTEELYQKQSEILADIDFLRMKRVKNEKELDFEYERLRYVNKLIKQREENNNTLSM